MFSVGLRTSGDADRLKGINFTEDDLLEKWDTRFE